jgi:RNA polymerase sigma factor (sigma-70 family)
MPSAANHLSQTSFCNDSDEDLLFYMSLQRDDQASAEEAWKEFYVRHQGYLVKECMRYQNTLGDLGVEDLVQETFVRAFKKAHTYERLETGEDHARARVRAWLGRIANRLFLSSLCGQPLIDFADDPYESVEAAPPATESEAAESEYMPVLRQGLQTLSEREREVLIASYAWYESGTGFRRMPSEELATLCTRFQTTPVNIRQIRSRALGKLEKYMEDYRNA